MLKTEGEARGSQNFPADIKSVTSLLVPFLKQYHYYQFSNKNQFKLDYERGVFRDIAVRRFKEVLKTEGEARGFQHFPADIKSVTSLLVPFLKQYQFSNKNQFKIEYERGVFRDIAVRRCKEVLKTEGEARGFQHFPADIKSVTSLLVPFLQQYQFSTQSPWPVYALGVFRDIAVRRFKEVLKTRGRSVFQEPFYKL